MAAIIGLSVALGGAIAALIYMAHALVASKNSEGDYREQAATERGAQLLAADKITQANAATAQVAAALTDAQAKIALLEKAAGNALAVPVAPGHGLDSLRGFAAVAGVPQAAGGGATGGAGDPATGH